MLPPSYPNVAPLAYVTPTPGMTVHPNHPHVNRQGQCFMNYLLTWKASSKSIAGLIHEMIGIFSAHTYRFLRFALRPALPRRPFLVRPGRRSRPVRHHTLPRATRLSDPPHLPPPTERSTTPSSAHVAPVHVGPRPRLDAPCGLSCAFTGRRRSARPRRGRRTGMLSEWCLVSRTAC